MLLSMSMSPFSFFLNPSTPLLLSTPNSCHPALRLTKCPLKPAGAVYQPHLELGRNANAQVSSQAWRIRTFGCGACQSVLERGLQVILMHAQDGGLLH